MSTTLVAALSLTSALARAQTDYWNGATDNWDVASNWSLGLPDSSNDVENDTSGTITFSNITALVNSFLNTSSGGFIVTSGSLSTTLNFTNTGTGEITVSGGSLNVGTDFVNSSSGTVTVNGGTLATTNDLLNQGNGVFTLSNGSLNVEHNFNNSGGATLNFSGGIANITNNFVTTGAVTIGDTFTVGGTGTLASTSNHFVNTNATFDSGLTQSGGTLYLQGGTLTTPTLTLNNGTVLDLYQNPTLNVTKIVFGNTDGGTESGSIYLEGNGNPPSPYTIAAGTTLTGNLGLIYGGSNINLNPSQLTNAGTILLNTPGLTTQIGGSSLSSVTNTALVQVSNGNNLLFQSLPVANSGTISVDSGTLTLNSSSLTNTGTLSITNGTLALSSSTLNSQSAATVSALNAYYATVTGSSQLTVTGASTLTGNNYLTNANILAQGSFTQSGSSSVGSTLYLAGGTLTTPTLTLNNGAVLDLYQNPTLNVTKIVFGNTDGGSETGSIYLEGNGPYPAGPVDVPSPYTIAAGTTLTGNLGLIYGGSNINLNPSQLTNAGTILLNTPGLTTQIGGSSLSSVTNTGLVQVSNGNNLVFETVIVYNSGTFLVGAATTAQFTEGMMQTAGTTLVDGNAAFYYNPTNTTNTGLGLMMQGGLLAGNGTVSNSVVNSGGTVRPGDLVGTLTILGNYTQAATAATLIDLGGTQQGVTYDRLNITGLATLAGDLDVKLVNGFTPTVGETFDILTYGTLAGNDMGYGNRYGYDNVVSLDNGFTYSINYGPDMAILTVDTVFSSVPESSTLVSTALMLGVGGLLLRRRQRAQEPTKRAA